MRKIMCSGERARRHHRIGATFHTVIGRLCNCCGVMRSEPPPPKQDKATIPRLGARKSNSPFLLGGDGLPKLDDGLGRITAAPAAPTPGGCAAAAAVLFLAEPIHCFICSLLLPRAKFCLPRSTSRSPSFSRARLIWEIPGL